MSEWHTIKANDIEIDRGENEVNLLVTQNDFGNVYATLTFEQIEIIHEEISKILPNEL